MNEMLLNKIFFSNHKSLKISPYKSSKFQEKLMSLTNGNSSSIKKPIFRSIKHSKGGIIECIAIPSPGSPYRDLNAFGIDDQDSNYYLNNYLEEVFNWFIHDIS